MSRVEDRLRDLSAPGEDAARRRAWRAVGTASPTSAVRSPRRALAAAAAGIVALGAGVTAAVTPAGSAVADWVRGVVAAEETPPRPAGLAALPGGGRVLVRAGRPGAGVDGRPGAGDLWIAGNAGRRRVLGAVDEATWSPRGRFVAATRGPEMIAVDLQGRRRWSVSATGTVTRPRWSPDGFRVAYLAGGSPELRLVAGDGLGDRLLARDVASVAPAWRPATRALAFARDRRVVVLDTDTGAVALRAPAPRALSAIAFSPDGERLLLAGRREIRILDARSGTIRVRYFARSGTRYAAAVWSRGGERIAVVRRSARRPGVTLFGAGAVQERPRRVDVAGTVGMLSFSPDGRWLLAEQRDTSTWLLVPLAGGRARRVDGVDRRFATTDARLLGWCCPASP